MNFKIFDQHDIRTFPNCPRGEMQTRNIWLTMERKQCADDALSADAQIRHLTETTRTHYQSRALKRGAKIDAEN